MLSVIKTDEKSVNSVVMLNHILIIDGVLLCSETENKQWYMLKLWFASEMLLDDWFISDISICLYIDVWNPLYVLFLFDYI